MSRSTIWRVLDEADLKPHRSVYWLNSHDPDFDAKAHEICQLVCQGTCDVPTGRLLICCDEKTGMQALGRPEPTQPAQPGQPEKRENDYIRHGTRTLIASSGRGQRGRLSAIWGRHGPARPSRLICDTLSASSPRSQGCDWVMDNMNTHWRVDICRVIADLCDVLRSKEKELLRT